MAIKANLMAVDGPAVGDWIRDGLDDWSTYTLGAHVPAGFDTNTLIRYREPSEADWHPIGPLLEALIGELATHTTTPDDCFHAVWEGYGWLHEGSSAELVAKRHWPSLRTPRPALFRPRRGWAVYGGPRMQPQPSAHQSIPMEVFAAPRFELPNRSYLLMRGAVQEARHIGHFSDEHLFAQSPDFLWPADRAWVLATDTDFSAVVIAGTAELQAALIASNALDAEPVNRSAPIADLGIGD